MQNQRISFLKAPLLTLVLVLGTSALSFGQCTDYTVGPTAFGPVDMALATPLPLADDDNIEIPIGFTFSFYGTDYTDVWVDANGYLFFGAPQPSDPLSGCLPNPPPPNNAIFAAWEDLCVISPVCPIPGVVQYLSEPGRLTVEWTFVTEMASGAPVTFQVSLYEGTNEIIVQYIDMGPLQGAAAVAGVENIDGSKATQFSCGAPPLLDGTAILYQCLPPCTDYTVGPTAFGLVPMGGAIPLPLMDNDNLEIPIGFTFGFYGTGYTTVWVDANGYLFFGAPQPSIPAPMCLPSVPEPNNAIFAAWEDLCPDCIGGVVQYLSEPGRLTIEWNVVLELASGGPLIFQVSLYEGSNEIIVQYMDMGPFQGAPAVAGVQNIDGSKATEFSCFVPTLFNGTAILYQCVCQALSCDSISIDVDPVCDGTAQEFTANYSGGVGPFTVDWDLDGDLAYDDFTGNPTLPTVLPVGANTIGVRVTDSCGAGAQQCTTSTTATVNALPTPVIAPDPAAFCTGGNVVLDAGAGYSAYLWGAGEVTQTISVTVAGAYSVTVTDANGCKGSDGITVTVNANPASDIQPDAPEICAGDSVTLDANPSAGALPYTYLWAPGGETTQTINVSPAVTTAYDVTVTDANNCAAVSNETVAVLNPISTAPTLSCPAPVCDGTAYTVSWTGVADAISYELDEDCNGTVDYTTAALSQGITNPVGDYCYQVRAVNDCESCTDYTVGPTAFGPVDMALAEPLPLADNDNFEIPIGFTFNFYGTDYADVWVDANGYLFFGAPQPSIPAPMCLPSVPEPNNAIYAAWEDLCPDCFGGVVQYLSEPGRLTIEWTAVLEVAVGAPVTFQVSLYEGSNDIIVQYIDMGPLQGAPAVAGVQNIDGSKATEFSCFVPTLFNGTAILYQCSSGEPWSSSCSVTVNANPTATIT
jgi:hypothetical protein